MVRLHRGAVSLDVLLRAASFDASEQTKQKWHKASRPESDRPTGPVSDFSPESGAVGPDGGTNNDTWSVDVLVHLPGERRTLSSLWLSGHWRCGLYYGSALRLDPVEPVNRPNPNPALQCSSAADGAEPPSASSSVTKPPVEELRLLMEVCKYGGWVWTHHDKHSWTGKTVWGDHILQVRALLFSSWLSCQQGHNPATFPECTASAAAVGCPCSRRRIRRWFSCIFILRNNPSREN